MKKLFADARTEALYRQLFDTPERRALLGELLRALLASDPGLSPGDPTRAIVATGWNGRPVGRAERRTPAEMEARGWWGDPSLVWPAAATASSTYGPGWTAEATVGRPTSFPHHGDQQGTWAPLAPRDGVQWLELTFPDDAPAATGLWVFETYAPGAVYAITDEDAGVDAAPLWQGAPGASPAEARVLDVAIDPPRRLRRVRVWLDTDVGATWNEIDTVALVTDRAATNAAVDWRSTKPVRKRRPAAAPRPKRR